MEFSLTIPGFIHTHFFNVKEIFKFVTNLQLKKLIKKLQFN